MPADLPPNLISTPAPIVRQAETPQNPNSQVLKRIKEEGQDAYNASSARKNEPGNN